MLILLLMLFGLGFQATPPTTAPEVVTETWENGKPKSSHEVVRSPEGVAVLHGKCTTYHKNGQLESEGEYAQGRRTGKWMFRWPNGKKQEYGSFEQDKRVGAWMRHDEKGWLCEEGKYVDGARVGPWKFYVDAKKTLDPLRSGEYGAHRFPVGAGGVTWEGNSFKEMKTGTWIARRADGTTMFVGSYTQGLPRGPWAFFHVDGSFAPDFLSFAPDFLSAQFSEQGRRLALNELPEALKEFAPDATHSIGPSTPDQALEGWLAGPAPSRAELLGELLKDPRKAFGAATAKLVALHTTGAGNAEVAERLLEAIVAPILGARIEWSSQSAEVRRTTCLRLFALFEVANTREGPWIDLLDPRWHWAQAQLEDTVFAQPPDIGGFLEPLPGVDPLKRPDGKYAVKIAGKVDGLRDLRRFGGGGTELACKDALAWIAAQQAADGSWNPAKHGGEDSARVGSTAACLLALLGDGDTTREGEHHKQVGLGLERLVRDQDPVTGRFDTAGADELYQHALALEAVNEALYSAPLPALRQSQRQGIAALASTRHADGSWPHCSKDAFGDPETTAKILMTLLTASQSGFSIDKSWGEAGLAWLAARVDAGTGLVRSDKDAHARQLAPKGEGVASALTLLARIFYGSHELSKPGADEPLLRLLGTDAAKPTEVGAETWNWGAYVMFQVGGPGWTRWNVAMKPRLVETQENKGPLAGSWAPTAHDAMAGGRIYASAVRALNLEVYFRYSRVSR